MSTRTKTARRTSSRRRLLALASVIVLVLVAVAVTLHLSTTATLQPAGDAVTVSPSTEVTRGDEPSGDDHGSTGTAGGFGEADGVTVEGDRPTVFDVDRPAVGNLHPDLLDALQRAATNAAKHDLVFRVNSGWRSPALQEQMLRDAVTTYGSEEEAARWVATADTSLHVSGDAVDLGPLPVLDWLAQHGAGYGLCQTYANEPWHYELRPDAVEQGCPATYIDPTHDPRMQP